MMNKLKVILISFVCFGFLPALHFSAVADEFEDMMNEEMSSFDSEKKEFDTYRSQLLSEFEEYKKIVEQEYGKYKQEILEHWDKPELSTKKKYVEYSPDMKSRKKVDYEKGQVEIEVIVPKGADTGTVNEKLKDNLKDLIAANQKTAWDKDKVSQKIEERLEQATPNIQKSKVSDDPIIAKIVTDTEKPTKKKVQETADKLIKTSAVTQKPSVKRPDDIVVTMKIQLPEGSMKKNAATYVDRVKQFSSDNQVSPSLVMAVMQTESAFNPMAKSYVPAYGLMQIVPKSAGLDASKKVLGKEVLLAPSFLYNSTNNIKMGTAYLNILYYSYLKKIDNKVSRMYCSIAAYNTGAGNVAKAFIGNTNINKASKTINRMTPDEVYDTLIRKLPHDETKDYLKRVTTRMKNYKAI